LTDGWRKIAALDNLADGLHEVMVGSDVVVIVRLGEKIAAVQGLCPHAFARLSEGSVDDAWRLHCPRHKACFGIDDGLCGPGWVLPPLRRYKVRVEDGDVLLSDPLRAID
jgi:3-phenylpropionate/trans-cinnamate dioxygenase ferredoxin subunit